MQNRFTLLSACLLLASLPLAAQKNQEKPVNAGAAFLLVNPDARSGALGDAITGLEPNSNDLFGNAAKIVFAGDWGVSASYSPWMYTVNDHKTHMGYMSAFKNFSENEGAGISMKYFDHGDITFRDENGMMLQQYHAIEYAIDAAYARKLSRRLSLAVSLRYIRSQLGQGTYNGLQQKPANAVAGDISLYFQDKVNNLDFGNRYCWGISFTNIGSRLQYTDDNTRRTFLPMNLRIGGGYSFVNTEDHQFTVVADICKLLVPTPPIYQLDANGQPTNVILKGKDPDRGVASAIFSSFADAPGGFQEELREFTLAGGLEYTYQHQFFARAGYFYEHPNKGFRQHFSAGVGVRVNSLELDAAYRMPTTGVLQRSSLQLSLVYTHSK
ncbi:type IX secretion system outer membrane channel protein PorV [Chitinophaga agrisoli]|uniref:Type IX secretion system outer membrane channel protein PorV n=1 Tax=Chitinophaga agrisoli TaxID=2607653 RepID=A0A5B2VPA5_9BACT|nr:type IX secretion system outer membrane channel protein PorV [Chitinophaga agrisoli]KAA2241553.1 type IX secretion system outer membrane channel protein PorV [Chitinophaga agrisoli]